ncbi:predicted protein [Histoplasma capsulatum var. duboisii H88]|uniref:Predicted protein n=2 Tax=Ajellomyces capsulatus TaxID=5037 RepID=F0UG06_AJEC8|nr:predicted protein [Histoplasma capsulatum H143]EGC44212.1 predicted protein [Histoplasma capsulatum var. duboisii H88]
MSTSQNLRFSDFPSQQVETKHAVVDPEILRLIYAGNQFCVQIYAGCRQGTNKRGKRNSHASDILTPLIANLQDTRAILLPLHHQHRNPANWACMIGVSPQDEAQQPDQLPTSPRSSAWNVLEFWVFAQSGSISLGATSVIPGLKRCCESCCWRGPGTTGKPSTTDRDCLSAKAVGGTIGEYQILAPEESIEPPLETA